MHIGASFKVSAGEEAVITALIVPTVADGAVEKHIISAASGLVKADINAAGLPHSNQGTLSRYGDAAEIGADRGVAEAQILGERPAVSPDAWLPARLHKQEAIA